MSKRIGPLGPITMAFDADKMEMLRARATVVETVLSEDAVRVAVNEAIERANKSKEVGAATDPVGPNQKPRMLQITAFICHAGAPNDNGAAFLAEDLIEAISNGLFAAPYVGMIDWNHDFNAYGCWHKAEWAYDEKAKEWGILAHGAVFAWRYAEIADKVLAMMSRQGWVDVSMAAMPGWYEPAETAEGKPYRVLRKPVFFTTSLLDVPPADRNGRGIASEDVESSNEDRTRTLMQASLKQEADNTEEIFMDELIAKIEAMMGEQKAELGPLVEAALKQAETEASLATTSTDLATANATLTALQAAHATLETVNAESAVALEAVQTELAAASEELTALQEFKATCDKAEADRVDAERKAARMTQLPESVKAALEKSAKKEEIVGEWMKLSDEEWTVRIEAFALDTPGRKSFADRTAEEGALSSAHDKDGSGYAIRRWKK